MPSAFRARALPCALLLSLALVTPAFAGSLDLPVRGAGLSFGNSHTFNGVRFNLRDRDLQSIRGVTVTLWAPGREPGGRIQGVSLGLVGTAADRIDGITLNLVGGAARQARGIAVGGLGLGMDDFAGVGVGGLGIGGDHLAGVMVGGLGIGGDDLTGVSIGAYDRFKGHVDGLQIGIFNYAGELHGVQLGVLNYAGNNRRGTRWLPLVNMHLKD